MSNKLNFTKKSIDAIELPEKGKRITIYDLKIPSLAIRVTSSGSKSFVVYRKVNGKPERYTIGKYPTTTIEQARNKSAEINATIAKGVSPNDQKQAKRRELTLDVWFKKYLTDYAMLHKRSWKKDEVQFNRYLSSWKNKKLSTIKNEDIKSLHAKIGKENGIYAANRLLSLIHSLFSKNITNWDKENPASGIKKFTEHSRERFLAGDELPSFFKALYEEPNTIARDFFHISLLTGARKTNTLEMQWIDINFTEAIWTIPQTKNGEKQKVPLVPAALTILENLKQSANSPWVFPGTGASGHLADPKKAWKRILSNANIDNLRIHDLRRSLGSWQASTGSSLPVIGKTLGHKNINTTAIYARLDLDPVRNSMITATNAMLAASTGEEID